MEAGIPPGMPDPGEDSRMHDAGTSGGVLEAAVQTNPHFDPDVEFLVVILLNTRLRIK
jgi:hypothetical protein